MAVGRRGRRRGCTGVEKTYTRHTDTHTSGAKTDTDAEADTQAQEK